MAEPKTPEQKYAAMQRARVDDPACITGSVPDVTESLTFVCSCVSVDAITGFETPRKPLNGIAEYVTDDGQLVTWPTKTRFKTCDDCGTRYHRIPNNVAVGSIVSVDDDGVLVGGQA